MRTGAAKPTPVRLPRRSSDDWTAGYAEGKRAYETAVDEHPTAWDYLKATAKGAGHGHAWVDGFKTGWSVARDDRPAWMEDRLAG